jgi:integrase
MLNWTMRRGLIDLSPMIGTKAPRPPAARDRVLSDNEVKLFWNSMPQAGDDFAPIFKSLLLTGQRLSEVAGMAWSELDLEKSVWTIPAARAKNKQPHDVDLSPPVIEIIEVQPRLGRYVFGGAKPNPPSGTGRAKKRVDAEMIRLRDVEYGEDSEIAENWRLHDLRRTAATGMAALGFPIEVVERVLNHISNTRSGIAAVYQRYHYRDERRAALNAWADYVNNLVM